MWTSLRSSCIARLTGLVATKRACTQVVRGSVLGEAAHVIESRYPKASSFRRHYGLPLPAAAPIQFLTSPIAMVVFNAKSFEANRAEPELCGNPRPSGTFCIADWNYVDLPGLRPPGLWQ